MFLDPVTLGTWLSRRRVIWQLKLLNAGDFARFSDDRGVTFSWDAVVKLWQTGLLRADLIESSRKLRLKGYVGVGRNEAGRYLYADGRRLRRRRQGWIDAAVGLPSLPGGIRPLFHPFRLYVLAHLERALALHVSQMQMLIGADRYGDLVDWRLRTFRDWSATEQARDAVETWNDVVALAVATEPYTYPLIFGTIQWQGGVTADEQQDRITDHWRDVAEVYRRIGAAGVEEARQSVCLEAERLDPNKTVHTMLRLAAGDLRLRLRGHLGGSVILLTMAETLRRATEDAIGERLPEEDELGFGQMSADVKQLVYGSNRILDGDGNVAGEFMRQFRLDYGVRTRWYVEGETEWYALQSAIGDEESRGIDLVNLRGQVVQRGGRGVAFRDSLRADLRAGVYSVVSLDGDRTDYVNVVRKAAEDDEICGMLFIAKSDFELENFTISELAEILGNIAVESGAEQNEVEKIHDAIKGIGSARDLHMRAAKVVPVLNQTSKGPEWGRRLMNFAQLHPRRPDGTERPVLEAIKRVQFGGFTSYHVTRKQKRIDPGSGRLIDRE